MSTIQHQHYWPGIIVFNSQGTFISPTITVHSAILQLHSMFRIAPLFSCGLPLIITLRLEMLFFIFTQEFLDYVRTNLLVQKPQPIWKNRALTECKDWTWLSMFYLQWQTINECTFGLKILPGSLILKKNIRSAYQLWLSKH